MDRIGESMRPVEIGVQEIYNLVLGVDGKIDTYIGMQEPRLVLFDHRLSQIEIKQEKTDARWELSKKESSDRRWQITLAFIASILSVVGTAAIALIQLAGKG
jgi:hypothetical protein